MIQPARFRLMATTFLVVLCTPCFNNPAWSQSIKSRLAKEKHFVSAGIGTSGYYGDLNDQFVIPYFAATADYGYRISPSISFRSSFSLYTIRAADENTRDPELIARNLSFEAVNFEFYAGFVFDLIPMSDYAKRPLFNPYLFAGLGFTTNNPTAKIEGNRHALRPLTTEGQEYGATAFVIPVGVGVRLKVTRLVSIVADFGYRFTNTDYLDDVSTVYSDPDLLPNELSRQLADRSAELGLTPRDPGDQRGSPGVNDGYMILSFRLETLLLDLLSFRRKAAYR